VAFIRVPRRGKKQWSRVGREPTLHTVAKEEAVGTAHLTSVLCVPSSAVRPPSSACVVSQKQFPFLRGYSGEHAGGRWINIGKSVTCEADGVTSDGIEACRANAMGRHLARL
jgi:hypothetical protein